MNCLNLKFLFPGGRAAVTCLFRELPLSEYDIRDDSGCCPLFEKAVIGHISAVYIRVVQIFDATVFLIRRFMSLLVRSMQEFWAMTVFTYSI